MKGKKTLCCCDARHLSALCLGSSYSGSSPHVGVCVCVCAPGFLASTVQSELNSFDEILIRNITISAPLFDEKLMALVNSCNNNRSQGIFQQRSRNALVISCVCVCVMCDASEWSELEDTEEGGVVGRMGVGGGVDDGRLQPIGADKLPVRPTAHLYAVVT